VKILALLVVIFSLNSFAQQFSTFQVGQALLNAGMAQDPNSVSNYSGVYDQILSHYQTNYETIGSRLADQSINNGVFGGTNMVGWKHANEFSSFKILFNRSIAPALFVEDKYIVNDEMTIEIDAATYLKKLKNDQIINITDKNLLAYAGLTFKRTMRFNHFADSVADGLQTKFDHLFFIFKFFKADQLEKLSEYDYITKEDSFTLGAGGLATAPITGYLSGAVGAYSNFIKKSKVSIQKLGADDDKEENEVVRLTVEDSKGIEAGGNATLLLDFFGLLKLTLLQYDFEYSYASTYKTYLSLYQQDLRDSQVMGQVASVLKFKDYNNKILEDNIKTKEIRQKEVRTSKYLAFIWCGIRNAATEFSEILKEGVVYKFFTHNYEKLTYKENFFSKLLSAALGKLLGFEQLAARTEVESKTVSINYEAQENILNTKRDFNIFADNILTVELGNRYRIDQNSKLSKDKVKNAMKDRIINRTNSYDKFQGVFKNSISAPAEFNSQVMLDNSNMEIFIRQNSGNVFSILSSICSTKSKSIFSKLRSLFGGCKSSLYSSYNNFLKEWTTVNFGAYSYNKCSKKYKWKYIFRPSKRKVMIQKCMEIENKITGDLRDKSLPLWRFKDFSNDLAKNIKSVDSLHQIFGSFNNKGYFQATINGSSSFKNYFSEGQVKTNIITQFQIDNNLRAPASVE